MTTTPSTAPDAAYRYWANLLAHRARRLDRDLVSQRVEQTFLELCRDLAPTVSLEIGAHQADFSQWIKREVPPARCVAFEANPYVHEKYSPLLADTGVEYLHLAISATSGTVELAIPREFHNAEQGRRYKKEKTNRMASLSHHRYAEKAETVDVPSVPLDDFVSLADDDVVVAWIDVEGASGPVLSSGEKVLSRASLIYIEVESEQVWDGQWLDLDVARFLAGRGLVPVLRDVQRPHQYNVVFAAAELAVHPRMARLANAAFRRKAAG
ncbi:FkbM family methyltransferase [Nocardioides antri]|uniref:FkbM family methyltransferase n=1 Tax=Nocardioides antri TaxID=2607659 RepID=A0A5B1M191_9ACTN|nr:FkbM family methyltransferase [Nocardioides antri]KAA1425587.1 FkbM family methyltransferase [Nocardioides antri]